MIPFIHCKAVEIEYINTTHFHKYGFEAKNETIIIRRAFRFYLPHPLKQFCEFFVKIYVCQFSVQLLTTKIKLGSGIINYIHIYSCKLLLVSTSKEARKKV